MSAKIIYERFLWFHNQVKQGQFPNASALAVHFEVAAKTAQRDIAFMRDRLHAPLEYVPTRRGYRYENDSYELPGLWLKENEVMSLLVSARLASTVPDSALTIRYYSPHNDEATTRDILPLHLLHYMGTWHLIAHCALKNGLRDFVLSRIRDIDPSTFTIACVPTASVKDYIRKNFGIMTGTGTFEVCLKFSPAVSPWLAEQVWHPAQQMYWENDKTLRLTFPVADFREVKREILRYGAHVEVVSPKALREEVKREIKKMKYIYR